jgi:hypothetical protein
MLTPSTITLAQGETGTVAVSTTLLTGFDQLLTFTITGLPPVIPLIPPFNFAQSARFTLNPAPGVKVSFAPNPVAVGTAVTLTLTVGNVVPGTYPCQVVATGQFSPNAPVTADLTLVVTPSTFSV